MTFISEIKDAGGDPQNLCLGRGHREWTLCQKCHPVLQLQPSPPHADHSFSHTDAPWALSLRVWSFTGSTQLQVMLGPCTRQSQKQNSCLSSTLHNQLLPSPYDVTLFGWPPAQGPCLTVTSLLIPLTWPSYDSLTQCSFSSLFSSSPITFDLFS